MDENAPSKSANEAAREIVDKLLLAARSDQFGWCEVNCEQLETIRRALNE